MNVLVALALLGAGLALVVVGAELFFDGVVHLARRLGISSFVLTVVLSGFEIENLAAGIVANANGLGSAAAGTFLGGTTFIALGVAGLGAMVSPIRADLRGRFLLWTAAAPLPVVLLGLDRRISRLDGALLLAWFVFVMAGTVGSERGMVRAEPEPGPAASDRLRRRRRSIPAARVLGGLALLAGGGELLGEGLRRTVAGLGVSATLLGNTVVAAGVEAEEVGRVVVPARRGRGDLAVANLAGTIVHFVALNAGVIALVRPLRLDDATVTLHLPAAAVATAVLCAALYRRQGLARAEGVGLLGLYAAYLVAAIAVA